MDECERGQLPPVLGQLFADGGDGRTLSVELPPGDVVWPDPGYAQLAIRRRPAFWLSDEAVRGELWADLRAQHEHSGLWPVLLEDSIQPWSTGQVAPDTVVEIDHYHTAAFMAEVWADWIARAHIDQLELLDPFGPECPGPAPSGKLAADPGVVADWYAGLVAERRTPLGLIAADRGADALAVMGWQGALNHNEWMVPLAAVVRSWEDRFGARVVGMGFNTLDLSIAAPPVTSEHALHVAAEHWTFCPDSITQGAGTLIDYAEQIKGRNAWSFWWD
ncbi:DUF4253 domain-containing protein [Streptosporangium sp. 'caverna']|jgi:uncharacterized protein DUF4253|uniref:DUF4253 domain-containing protein n=1 Tax=Streptosporangium sp. 'caverna' TaxID=2202249 RepID=UPI000D7DD1AD|nr:DUF4253 domain-containing protein [Streptosporangium sp. 'caverna']AWS46053.1 hypothetical protein DKM19_36910 [Streptosporangium sp. 'caverna']